MGSDAADTLMSYLPPVGWADVATRRDLDALEERMDLRFQLVDQRFGAIDQRFDSLPAIFATKADLASQTKTVILGVAALNLSFGALALGIVQALR